MEEKLLRDILLFVMKSIIILNNKFIIINKFIIFSHFAFKTRHNKLVFHKKRLKEDPVEVLVRFLGFFEMSNAVIKIVN